MDGGGGGLRQLDVVLCDVVGRLVLGDLHAGAHVALPVEEEGEGAGQVLAGEADRETNVIYLNIRALL